MINFTVKPSTNEQKLAQKSLASLSILQAQATAKSKVKIMPAGTETVLEIPSSAMNILYTVMREMAEGKTVSVLPADQARKAEADMQIARARIW